MNVYLDFIGCRLNEAEIERFARQFRAAGHDLVNEPAKADLVVVNTCAVTAAAASDSRQKVRQAARSGNAGIVVTGCWATLEPQAAAQLPGVRTVVSNPEKDSLVSQILGLPEEKFDLEPIARVPLPGARLRTRAFIKVQDGCDNRCTFCVTTLARGAGYSRPIVEVLSDVRAAIQGGAREIVLTGVHLGSWGHDLNPRQRLTDMVRALLADTDVQRLRLSSLEPWDLHEAFFNLWSDSRLCPHLHLPLQSGAKLVLRRMARKTTPETFSTLIAQARSAIPDVAITTDVIVGFPGEGEAEFEESLEFVRSMRFAGGHVFTYSPRPRTAAARYSDQVPPALRRERNARMRAVLAQSAQAYNQRFLGQPVEVLWEASDAYGPEGWRLRGLTGNYLRVSTLSPEKLWNQVSRVRLVKINGDGLEGVILDQRQPSA
jgi:threonylcarbamoyladenosine tRNA methylthiotransferase MtaB